MALIVTKQTVNNLILAPREGMRAAFQFDNNWTEIRCGILFTMVAGSDDDQRGEFETVLSSGSGTEHQADDYATIGLVPSTQQVLPGEDGSLFAGVGSYAFFAGSIPPSASRTNLFYNFTVVPDPGQWEIKSNYFTFDGTRFTFWPMIVMGWKGLIYQPADKTGTVPIPHPEFPDPSGTQEYCGFYGMKFVINNRGAPNQSITISASSKQIVSGASYTPAKLQAELNAGVYSGTAVVPWNDSGAPREIPDAFWIRLPFFLNRLKIAQMRIIKYS